MNQPSRTSGHLPPIERTALPVSGLLLACLATAACSSGDAGSIVGPPNGGTPPSDWEPGLYLPAEQFAAQCAAPRSGTDPSTGLAFPDVQGTVLAENNWLRSWSNDLYLWYDEIVDQDPGDFANTEAYFEQLRTFATTPSGTPRDKFHFTVPTDEWYALSQAGVSAGYGAEWVVISATPPREILIAYTQPNSPATDEGLERGMRVLEVDGVDAVNANDAASIAILNAALFPTDPGESHTFLLQERDTLATRQVAMNSEIVTLSPVQNAELIPTATGTVGYLLFNDHIATAEQALIDEVSDLASAGIDDLILDVRYNGGGFLAIASELAYMIAGPLATGGRVFEELEFNDKYPSTNPVTGNPLEPLPFLDQAIGLSATMGEDLPTLDLDRVFVITGANTCSASESIMNSLLGIGVEVIQIGETTCGKPYGFYPADNCGTTYFSIQFRGVNELGFGDYSDGFAPSNTPGSIGTLVPGCAAPDDFTELLGSPVEARLEAALQYRADGSCPAPVSVGGAGSELSKTAPSVGRDGFMPKPPSRSNKWMGDAG